MRLSDLYKKCLAQAEDSERESDSSMAYESMDAIRCRTSELDSYAGWLAHCIALFGDQEIAEVDIDRLQAQVEGWACGGENPWYRGLRYLRRLTATSSA